MNFLEQISDQNLEKCFIEMMYEKQGLSVPHVTIRELWTCYKKENKIDLFPLSSMYEPILFEIARRKYRDEGIQV